MCFSAGVFVKGLEVNCPSWFTILFGTDNHSVAPSGRGSCWYAFKYTKTNVSVQVFFHLFSEVKRDRDGLVVGHRLGIWINH